MLKRSFFPASVFRMTNKKHEKRRLITIPTSTPKMKRILNEKKKVGGDKRLKNKIDLKKIKKRKKEAMNTF